MTRVTFDPVAGARRLAADLLIPCAEEVDVEGVPQSHVDAVKASGLLGMNGPVDLGGCAAPFPVFREVVEVLAGADCSTWFVQAQHHTPLAMLVASDRPVRDRLGGPLSRGELLGGVAFAHLRRWPDRPVQATALPGGRYRFDGEAPWCTAWGLNDVILLGGATPEGTAVFAYVPATDQPGLQATAPLRLAALEATRTVRLRLMGLEVGPDDVVTELPLAAFGALDRRSTVNVNPAVFGLTGSALDRLDARGDATSRSVAATLADQLAELRAECYRLYDDVAPDDQVEDRLARKAEAMSLMCRSTAALVAAGAGASMDLAQPAQRLAREALFLLVQAQTAETRQATLHHLAVASGVPARS